MSIKCVVCKKSEKSDFSQKIIGFFFDIKDKFHPVAWVYLPRLADMHIKWEQICPQQALRLHWAHDLLGAAPFSRKRLEKKQVIEAQKCIDGNNRDFKTQSLRIGAQTFLVTYGLPEVFVKFLARKKTPE